MDNFIYDAPNYCDFSKDLDNHPTGMETFFDIEHDKHNSTAHNNKSLLNETEDAPEQRFYTPSRSSLGLTRKSCSLVELSKLSNETTESISISKDLSKVKIKLKKTNSTKLKGCGLSGSLDKMQHSKSKFNSCENLRKERFVSMAEAIQQFHQKTPLRFHSKSRNDNEPLENANGAIPLTVPQSPRLVTKQRMRGVHVLSQEEQEAKELEEMKKFKIKARSINTKILYGEPTLPSAEVKKVTIPKPFHLTQVIAKKSFPAPTTSKPFHAKSVPKAVFELPKPIIKSHLYTIPHTPMLMKRYNQDNQKIEIANETCLGGSSKSEPLKSTKPIPFSFEERDKELFKRHEKLIQEILEKENKAREFHARPIPKSIMESKLPQNNQSDNEGKYKSKENLSEQIKLFKAKPAKVLYVKPFEPKKDETHLIKICEFQLHSEHRAEQRKQFEDKIKIKEQKIEYLIKKKKEVKNINENRIVAEMRKTTIHKAQPIRKYKEVKVVPAKQLTEPVSPKFSKCKKHD